MSMRTLLCGGLLAAVAACDAHAAEFVIDDFDGGRHSRASAPTVTPDQTGFALADMFGRAHRAELLPSGQTIPFAMSDDSVEGAAGNNPFAGDAQGIFGKAKTDAFFGVVDLLNNVNPAGTGTAEWTIDISGLSSLGLSVDAGAMGDFEAADQFSFSVSIDGGAFSTIMMFSANDAIEHTYKLMDAQLAGSLPATHIVDPIVYFGADGVLGGSDDVILDKSDPTTGALSTFTAAIAGTGSSMVVRFSAANDGGDEAFAFDNLKLLSDFTTVPTIDADFNNDNIVNGNDFLIWQRNRGIGSTNATGDADGNGVVDAADLTAWKSTFGGPPAVGAIAAVPEPASLALCGLAFAAAAVSRRRRAN